MIDGLKLTLSGAELRKLLDERIADHQHGADSWAHEKMRATEDETEDTPLPDHVCVNEAERHAWRVEVLRFLRDHVEAGETYRLSASHLEFGELLPPKPEWLEQDEYEERTRVGFMLERVTKAVDRLAIAAHPHWWSSVAPQTPGIIEETDVFRTTRVDTGDGPEAIMIERK